MASPADARRTVAPLGDLLDALATEERLLGELRHALAMQRAGVARDDAARVDAATHAVSRAVLTLDEARRRREGLTEAITGEPNQGLSAVQAAVGPVPELVAARAALRKVAATVAHDLATTQAVLRGAVRAGEALVQAMLASTTGPAASYAPSDHGMAESARTGVLLNRSA